MHYLQTPEIMMAHQFVRNFGIKLNKNDFYRSWKRPKKEKEVVRSEETSSLEQALTPQLESDLFSYHYTTLEESKPQKEVKNKKYLKPNLNLLPESEEEIRSLKIKIERIHRAIQKILAQIPLIWLSRSRKSEVLTKFRKDRGYHGTPKITPKVVRLLMAYDTLDNGFYKDFRKIYLNLAFFDEEKQCDRAVQISESIIRSLCKKLVLQKEGVFQ